MFGIHWIPKHRGNLGNVSDQDIFARWNPSIMKIITVENTVPYLGDVSAGAFVLVRNHPMSEDGNRRATADALPEMPSDPAAVSAYAMPGPRPPLYGVLETADLPAASGEPPQSIGARHAQQCQSSVSSGFT